MKICAPSFLLPCLLCSRCVCVFAGDAGKCCHQVLQRSAGRGILFFWVFFLNGSEKHPPPRSSHIVQVTCARLCVCTREYATRPSRSEGDLAFIDSTLSRINKRLCAGSRRDGTVTHSVSRMQQLPLAEHECPLQYSCDILLLFLQTRRCLEMRREVTESVVKKGSPGHGSAA